ncbi:hypothetical protein WJX72_010197 [[Myrmecia] bisecta]|uniref:N-acetyltransferase domain-containing protein n=1 Tax=[Myrmecia] bisecta TaxID=41462 RepID=A0AAW1QBB0_9CHLO
MYLRWARERPTLQPFVAPSSKQRRLVEFRHKESVQGGTLLIRPLSKNWLMPATDLLTATFAEAMGYLPVYRTYLRRQILQYLDSHMNLAPKSVILVAVLISDGHQPIPDDAARSSSFTTIAIEDVAARSDSLGSSSVRSSPEPERDSNGAGAGVPGSERASSAGSDASTSGREDDDAEERFGVLVGTGELSFAASTRTKFLTLNAPEDCGYLCNMAVAEDYQRRGFGMALLRALERTAEIVEQPNLYLHNRFQDDPAAALYKRAGYEVVKKDNFLMMLLGRDRRYLMRKRLQMKVPQES